MTERTAPGRRATRRGADRAVAPAARTARAAHRDIWLDDANLFGVDASAWAPDPDEFDALPGDPRDGASTRARAPFAAVLTRFSPLRLLRLLREVRR